MDSASMHELEQQARRPRQNLFWWVAIAVAIGVASTLFLFDRGAGAESWTALRAVAPGPLAVSLAAAMGSWLLTTASLVLVARAGGFGRPLRAVLPAYLAGNFCGLSTPFGSGGTPGQAYFISRLSIEPGAAFAVALVRGLISSVVVAGGAGSAVMLARGWLPAGAAGSAARSAIVIVAALLLGATLLAVSDRPGRWAAAAGSRANRPRVRRFWESFAAQSGLFNQALRTVGRRPVALGMAAVCEIGAWVLIVAVGPLVLVSLGYRGPIWIIFLRILALFLVVPMSPTPGSAGTAELGFFVVGQGLVPSAVLAPAVLLWRLILYYLPLAVGGICFVWLGSERGVRDREQ